MIIKRVDVWSLAQIVAAIYGVFGLIAGIFFSLAAFVGYGVSEEVAKSASWLGPFFGVAAILALPVAYAIMGYLGGLIGAWVFNNVCQSMGGLKVEVEQVG